MRSYVLDLWSGAQARADATLSAFWSEWSPPPGSADEIPRETVFAAARRQMVSDQRRVGSVEADLDETEMASEKDPASRVAAHFRHLTPKQQEMVRLHLQHRFEVDEMAEITELSAGGAEQVLHTALNRLNGGASDDVRPLQLALAGVTGERLAAESPETRARVAELRVTIEVTRQVLARGVDTYRPRKLTNRRRTPLWLGLGVGVLVLALVAWWWWRRDAEPKQPVWQEMTATGSGNVSIQRSDRSENMARAEQTARSREVNVAGAAKKSASAKNLPSPISPERTSVRPPSSEPISRSRADVEQPHAAAKSNSVAAASGEVAKSKHKSDAQSDVLMPDSVANLGSAQPAELAALPASIPEAQISGPARPLASTPEVVASGGALAALRSNPAAPAAPKPVRSDTNSITELRQALRDARWPTRQEVRVAALINAFPPTKRAMSVAAEPFTTRVESSVSPWDPARRLVRVSVRARDEMPTARAAATVILLLDVSGSMDAPNRLPLVQEAIAGLLRRLSPEDRVGIVTYAGESRVLLPPQALTDQRAVRQAVGALEAKGRTNGGAGLREALALAREDAGAHREPLVILCTDGDFNMGETSEVELGALVDAEHAKGVRLAIFGFGRAGQIDARLEALAARAQGGSGYVNTRAEAEQALVGQLDTLFAPVAERWRAMVEFAPSAVARVRNLGEGEMKPTGDGVEFLVGNRDLILPGEEVSALFEIEPAAKADSGGNAWRVRVEAELNSLEKRRPYESVSAGGVGAKEFVDASVDFRFAAATAAFGEALQSGAAEGASHLDEIENWARAALGEDVGGYRAEFMQMVEQARRAAQR